MQTKQQQRAAFALNEIESLSENGKIKTEVATFIVGMPNMILSNGLGQTLVFLLAKGKDKQKQVFDILKKWLTKNPSYGLSGINNLEFLKSFNTISQQQYIQAQDECLRLLEWLKRYARAFEDKKE